MKYLIIIISVINISFCFGNNQNYESYHKLINNAERVYFINKDIDSCLYYYDKCFNDYEFIFVRDIMNVAQISYFEKKNYKKYIELSFKFGIKIEDYKKYEIFKTEMKILLNNKKLKIKEVELNKIYLKNIDYKYLNWIYKLAIKDQIDKYKKDYNKNIIVKTTKQLIDTIKIKGFPGEKLLGLTDTLIFKKLNKKYLDINESARKQKITMHYQLKGFYLFNYPIFPIFLHLRCSSCIYFDIFYKEILKGNMHPRDLAFISDFDSQFKSNLQSYCSCYKFQGIYFFSPISGELKNKEDIEKSNILRKKLMIVSYEIDLLKNEYQKKYKFQFYNGYGGTR